MDGLTLLGVAGAMVVLVAGLLLVVRAVLQVVGVQGDSMTPTYQHGDQLLVLRRGFRRRLRVGAVVVCLPPPGVIIPDGERVARSQLIVKRVAGLPDGRLYVLGDAPQHSMDSRMFGPLTPDLVRGVVVRRLRGLDQPPSSPSASRDGVRGADRADGADGADGGPSGRRG
ncbi:S26 family signal peptidase [Micromonospora sp. CPCC 206061]|uniref:S26 family signal peptidase n=1 Tax=Micromonospora sp. CPCC 206061 TaxID=3122410 RepID=UPI002FF33530